MTVESIYTPTRVTCDETVGPFTFNFPVYDVTDITCYLRDSDGNEITLVQDTDYTVTIATDPELPYNGGTITFIGAYETTPPDATHTLVICRVIPYLQEIHFIPGGPRPAETLEEGYDRAVMLIQQLKELLGRSLALPPSSPSTGLQLPEPQAEYFLRWNAAATALENQDIAGQGDLAVSDYIKTLLDDLNAAAARTTLEAEKHAANLTTLAGLTIAANTILGKNATGDLSALIGNEVRTILADAPFVIGSDADGDMWYRESSKLARLAKGTADYKMFMKADGSKPEWAQGVKEGSFTRNLTAASGDVSYTGVGFSPSLILFLMCVEGSQVTATWGWANSSVQTSISLDPGSSGPVVGYNNYPIRFDVGSGNIGYANLKSLDSDGFTVTWQKVGSPSGNVTIKYLAIR